MEGDVRVAPRDHLVLLYRDDDDMADVVGSYLAQAVEAGGVAFVIATPGHLQALRRVIQDRFGDPVPDGLHLLDADDVLRRFVRDGRVEAQSFVATLTDVVGTAAVPGRPLLVYAEMVARLWDAGQVGAAIELESLWNDLTDALPCSLVCAYRRDPTAPGDADRLGEVCRLHTRVIHVGPEPREGSTRSQAFTRSPGAPRQARRFVDAALTSWGRRDLAHDAALAVSELVTNAVVHARSDVTVTLALSGDAIRIAVADARPDLPPAPPGAPALFADSGRGLALVSAVARRWGTDTTPEGKVVWVELAR